MNLLEHDHGGQYEPLKSRLFQYPGPSHSGSSIPTAMPALALRPTDWFRNVYTDQPGSASTSGAFWEVAGAFLCLQTVKHLQKRIQQEYCPSEQKFILQGGIFEKKKKKYMSGFLLIGDLGVFHCHYSFLLQWALPTRKKLAGSTCHPEFIQAQL